MADDVLAELASPKRGAIQRALRRHAKILTGVDLDRLSESIEALDLTRPVPESYYEHAITQAAADLAAEPMSPPAQKFRAVVGYCKRAKAPEPTTAPTNGSNGHARFGAPDPTAEEARKKREQQRLASDLRAQREAREAGPRILAPERERRKADSRPAEGPRSARASPAEGVHAGKALGALLAGVGRKAPDAAGGAGT